MPTQTATLGALPEDAIVDPPRLKHVRSQGRWEGQMKTLLTVRDLDPLYTGEPGRAGGDLCGSAVTPDLGRVRCNRRCFGLRGSPGPDVGLSRREQMSQLHRSGRTPGASRGVLQATSCVRPIRPSGYLMRKPSP